MIKLYDLLDTDFTSNVCIYIFKCNVHTYFCLKNYISGIKSTCKDDTTFILNIHLRNINNEILSTPKIIMQ